MRKFGPKALRIIRTAKARPELTQQEVADLESSTRGSVGVILCRARKAGLIETRKVDKTRIRRGRSVLYWLPDEHRFEYRKLRRILGVKAARRAMRDSLGLGGE